MYMYYMYVCVKSISNRKVILITWIEQHLLKTYTFLKTTNNFCVYVSDCEWLTTRAAVKDRGTKTGVYRVAGRAVHKVTKNKKDMYTSEDVPDLERISLQTKDNINK